MNARHILALAVLLATLAATAHAAGTRHRDHAGAQFLEGELEGAMLDSHGWLRASTLRAVRIASTQAHLWSVAPAPGGEWWVGSGDGGALLRSRGDALQVHTQLEALELLSLLPRGEGVLVGTSPDGQLYSVSGDASATLLRSYDAQTIWSLAPGREGGEWLAGVGPGARLLADREGRDAPELVATLPAENLLQVVADGPRWWLGTQGPGLVYLWDGEGAPRLVYEPGEDEIAELVPDGNGGVTVVSLQLEGEDEGTMPGSRVTWLPGDGSRHERHRGAESFLSAVADGDRLLLAQAEPPRLLALDGGDRLSLLASFEDGAPVAIGRGRDGEFALALADAAALVRLRPGRSDAARFRSPVLDVGGVARWGQLRAEGQVDGVRLSTRSGVRSEPDESWSAWGPWQDNGSTPTAPAAPYLQYRLQWPPRGEVAVQRVALAWAERNLPPRIFELRVEPAGGELARGGMSSSPQQVSQRFDDGLAVEYSVQGPMSRAEPSQVSWARGLRTVRWEVFDPNEDRLRFALSLQRLPGEGWAPLVEGLDAAVWGWDSRAHEDGRYRLRLVASDAVDNAPGEGAVARRESGIVVVDNTAPQVEDAGLARQGERWRLRLRARDAGSGLRELAWRSEGTPAGEWAPLAPVDGVTDGASEEVDATIDPGPGHTIWLRAVDAAGNSVQRALPVGGR